MTMTGKHWLRPTLGVAMPCGYRTEPKTYGPGPRTREQSSLGVAAWWSDIRGRALDATCMGHYKYMRSILLYAVDGRLTLHGMSPPCGYPLSPAGRPTPQRLHIPIMLEFVSSCPRVSRNSCKFMTAGMFWKFGCCRSLVCTMVRS